MANDNQQVALLILKALNFGLWIGLLIHNYYFKNDQRAFAMDWIFYP